MISSQFFGRIVQNPTVQYTSTGTAFCNLALAVSDNYREKDGTWKERTYFFDFKAWSKTAEHIAEKYGKGLMVYIEAKPVQERWEKEGEKRSRVTFDIRHIEDIERFGRKRSGEPSGDKNDYSPPAAASGQDFDDSDIPF